MLLRLLPAPTASQPSPPTILFTLPLPMNPYTAKSVPLPPALQNHRSLCASEGLECPNPLLGEKSSWIGGIVDEVTFAVLSQQVTVHFIDGTTKVMDIERDCMQTLRAVIQQVQLSFSVQQSLAPPPVSPTAAPPTSPKAGSSRRTPSTLLCSLLSPLMTASSSRSQQQQPQSPSAASPKPSQNLSRLHRRQARSLLVDAYRRYVLVTLRECLPSTYIGWITQSELAVHQQDWERIKRDVTHVLDVAGVPATRSNAASHRSQALSARFSKALPSVSESASSSTCSDSSDDESCGPDTPATSTFNHSSSSCSSSVDHSANPIAQLSALPLASTVPIRYRDEYSSYISELSTIATRMSSLRKRRTAMEREEGRKTWLETMEASRAQERSQRRAWSNRASVLNGHTQSVMVARPLKASGLWRMERASVEDTAPVHPAMMITVVDSDAISVSDSEEDDVFSADIISRPLSPMYAAPPFLPPRPRLQSFDSDYSMSSSSSDECESDDSSFREIAKSSQMWTREPTAMDVDEELADLSSVAPSYSNGKQQPWGQQAHNQRVVVVV